MICNSIEAEKLMKLIADKKKYWSKLTNKTASQFLQAEILFLERDILPCVEAGSQILTYELTKHYASSLSAALRFDCNGLVH